VDGRNNDEQNAAPLERGRPREDIGGLSPAGGNPGGVLPRAGRVDSDACSLAAQQPRAIAGGKPQPGAVAGGSDGTNPPGTEPHWLFIGHPEAGWKSATTYSILGNCKLLKLNPEACLTWVLPKLAAGTNQSAALLPHDYMELFKEQSKSAAS
jgi:hypothetical protein